MRISKPVLPAMSGTDPQPGTVVFFTDDGTRLEGQVMPGYSLMEAAVSLGVPGIPAECGGAAACATCHVQVDPEWADRTGHAGHAERELLELLANAGPRSRLACQIIMRDVLDGIIVHVPGETRCRN